MDQEYSLQFASATDLDNWMNLVDVVKDNFPGMSLVSYRETASKNICRGTGICVKYYCQVVGVLLFSTNAKCLSFLAVHPKHRKKGLATEMIQTMMARFPIDSEITVTTFRENDVLGLAPRNLYKKLGFKEDVLLMEHNYPHQKFKFKR